MAKIRKLTLDFEHNENLLAHITDSFKEISRTTRVTKANLSDHIFQNIIAPWAVDYVTAQAAARLKEKTANDIRHLECMSVDTIVEYVQANASIRQYITQPIDD